MRVLFEEAQHVIMVEPLLDPAVQAQAIGRVHRIGQTRKTYVHHFIVKDSVEDNVHRLAAERAAAVDVSAMSAKAAAKSDQQLTVRCTFRAIHGALAIWGLQGDHRIAEVGCSTYF